LLPGEVLKAHGGGKTGHSIVFQEPDDPAEGYAIVCEVGKVEDTPVVAWDLDYIGCEATGTA
jgi:hypothetical protein